MTGKAIILLISALLAIPMSGQASGDSNFMVSDHDTVLVIPTNAKVIQCSTNQDFLLSEDKSVNPYIKSNYSLRLYEDQSVYELCIGSDLSEMIIISTISWGDYKVYGDKIFFHDRIAGFEMIASITSDGFKFTQDYLPNLDKYVWMPSPAESEDLDEDSYPIFYVFFDNHKALHYRNSYNKRHTVLFEFTPGIYLLGGYTLDIGNDGKWRHKYEGLMLAEGEWYREQNVLVLRCPKLKCNFHVAIGDNKLQSMLLLGDLFGRYYFNKAEHDKLLGM